MILIAFEDNLILCSISDIGKTFEQFHIFKIKTEQELVTYNTFLPCHVINIPPHLATHFAKFVQV